MPDLNAGKRTQQENADWLDELVRRYSRPLKGYFLRRVGSVADSEDLVQEAFSRLARLRNPAVVDNPSAYLFSTAANLLRDRARRAETHQSGFHEPFDDVRHGASSLDSPEARTIAREDLEIVRRAIRKLPARTQTVFLLHRFDGLKYREIAGLLGIAVSTVEKHIIAVLATLAESLHGDDR